MRDASALCAVGFVAALGMTACGGASAVPTSPAGSDSTAASSQVQALNVSCPTPLLIGQRGPCLAIARLGSGLTRPVFFDEAVWSSASPDVVAVDTLGVVRGQSAGQSAVSASYGGRQGSTTVLVTAEDGLRVESGQADQGAFTAGSTVTMWLQGYYSVNSAATGRLSLQISDQVRTIARSAPLTVAKGGDFFLLSSTFVVPDDSVEVCRTAILEVGAVTITAPQPKTSWSCLPIRR